MSETINVPTTVSMDQLYMSWPTSKFRWYVQNVRDGPCWRKSQTLQQWWQYDNGSGEWKDIEVVKETNEKQ